MKDWIERYTEGVLRHPWWAITATSFFLPALAAGLPQVRLPNDYRYFFSEAKPHLVAFEQFERTYTSSNNILIVIQPQIGLATERANLVLVMDVTRRGWQIPHTMRVDSTTNFQHIRALDDDVTIQNLVPSPESVIPEEIRSIVSHEPATARRKTGELLLWRTSVFVEAEGRIADAFHLSVEGRWSINVLPSDPLTVLAEDVVQTSLTYFF